MDIDQWYNFFLMVGGGAADLAGLVFIAMLINLSIIIRDATHKNPAIATLTGFTAVFMICAFVFIGNIAGIYVVASVAIVLSFAFFISGAWLLITGIQES
ncbi:MAG TPA: hypothetical protein VK724_14860 [Bryobacteraceae bacterium]|nr:hypothetical protein [Bryobacteraceae bacterium]